jgi:hypothetical protein
METSKNSHFDKLNANGYIKNQLVPFVLSLSKNEGNPLFEVQKCKPCNY